MNPGAATFLIFLFIVGAFAGLGYLIPEMNQRAVQIQELNQHNQGLQAELAKAQQTIQAQQSAIQKANARIVELERLSEAERLAKEEALNRLQNIQQAYNNAQLQIAALQTELQKFRENTTINTSSREICPTNIDYGVFLPWLPPVFALAFAGGYGFHRVSLSQTSNPTRQHKAERLSASKTVTVLMPRERIPEFIKWLRSQ